MDASQGAASGPAARAPDDETPEPPVLTCVICSTPRCGSWLLADQLLRTGIAGRPEEYFRLDWYERFLVTGQVRYRHMKSHRKLVDASLAASAASQAVDGRSFKDFMDGVRKVATTRNGVLAIKVHWRQLARAMPSLRAHMPAAADTDAEVLESWLPNVHYVFLRRADKLRQAISFHRALHSGAWWALAGDQSQPRRPPPVDLHHVHRLHRELTRQEQAWRAFFASSSRPTLELVYEDLARRPRETTARVLRFLGLDASCANGLPPPRLRRQADRSTSRAVFDFWVDRRSGAFRSPVVATDDDTTQSLMRTDLIVVDHFFEDPAGLRDYALRQPFYHPYGFVTNADGTRRAIWMASRFRRADDCPLKSSRDLIARLEEITDEQIDLEYWRADFPVDREGMPAPDHRLVAQRGSLWNCCFHCKPDTSEAPGTGVHNHVVDTWNAVGPHGWSGVVYLNGDAAPVSNGLKLWRNRDPARNAEWMTPAAQWELVDAIGNVSNRLVLYRGNLPHSGSPGWGDGLRSGRLCLTFYFRTLEPVRRKPLALAL